MGLADFCRSIFAKSRPEKQERLAEKDLDAWIQQKEHEDEEALATLTKRVAHFLRDLDAQLAALERVDLDRRRTDEQVKAIAKGNLHTYLGHVHVLKTQLKGLDAPTTDTYLAALDDNFLEFHRKAHKNYEKATLLVGKDIGKMRALIGTFALSITKKYTRTTLAPIKELRRKLQHADTVITDTTQTLIALRKRMAETKKEERQRAAATKRRQAEAKKERARYDAERAALHKEVHRVKMLIDFKALANLFHASKEMRIVKEHRDNFAAALEKDDGALLPLLEEAKQTSTAITEGIARINSMRKALQPPRKTRMHVATHARSLAAEQERASKRLEKAQQDREALIDELRTLLATRNVVLER